VAVQEEKDKQEMFKGATKEIQRGERAPANEQQRLAREQA
jgi:hypothetical protein